MTPISSAASAPSGLGRWGLTAIFLLALAPRLVLALVYLRTPIGLDDMYQYDMLARSIAAGKGYRWYQRQDVAYLQPYLRRFYEVRLSPSNIPEDGYLTTFRAPGYPFFLAGLYMLTGLSSRLAAARIAQAILTATLGPLTALLALRAGVSRRAAVLSGIAIALYPILWMYPLGLGSENLFMPLLLATVVLLLEASRRASSGGFAASGFVMGAAILTRPALVLFLPLACFWVWRHTGLRSAMITALTAMLVIIPWSVRNSLILGRPAFIENTLGYNLFVGYHPDGDGGFVNEIGVIPTRFLDDNARDRWTREQALSFTRSDPGRVPELMARRLVYFWGLEDRELIYFYANNYFGPIPAPGLVGAYVVLVAPLILIGLSAPWGMAASTGPARSLIGGLIIATLTAYIPILAEPRFHLPLIPFLAVYAASVWASPHPLLEIRRTMKARQPATWLAAAVCAILVAIWIIDFAGGMPRLLAVLSPGGNKLWLNY